MGTPRVRLKKSKAATRWKKGHSSASNPTSNKHRDAVKGTLRSSTTFRRTSAAGESSLLTEENVTMHEAAAASDDDDSLSCSQSTTSTCYSFIETAHPAFHKVKKFWSSPVESHREVCAVLAAVSEVVKSKDGKESETEYFAALVSALQSAEDESSVTAVMFLLNIITPEVNKAILQSQYSVVSKLLVDMLTRYEKGGSTALLRSLVSCSLSLLSAQSPGVWADKYTLHYLQIILNFITHSRPKVRKAVHEGLAHMIQAGVTTGDTVTFHPAVIPLAKFCLGQLEQADTSTLHMLNFLKDTLAHMTTQSVKKLCERILKLLLQGNTLMRSQCLKTLHGLFSRVAVPQGLTDKLNGQLISALYDYQPKVSDVQQIGAWTVVMEAAHVRLIRFDRDMCLAHLPKLFKTLMALLLSPSPTSRDIVCTSLMSSVEQCLQGDSPDDVVSSCFSTVDKGLKYQHQSAWGDVLQVIGCFYRCLGNSHHSLMAKSLTSMSALRNTPGFPYTDQLDKTFGAAIKSMGPRKVLESVPLQLDPTSNSENSWLLLVMRDHVSHAELGYFVDTLLPVATTMRMKAEEVANQNAMQAAMFRTLYSQVWDLLPAFCTSPTDVKKSFNSIARLLGDGLKEQPQLRPTICRSLRLIIETSANNVEDMAELSRYAKNYLPVLFNIYTDVTGAPASDDSNSFILDCIQGYASIVDQQLLETFTTRMCSKFTEDDVTMRSRLVELMTRLCDKVGMTLLDQLYQSIVCPLIQDDGALQKKGYLLLDHMMSCDTPNLEEFLQAHIEDIQQLLLKATGSVKSASKKLRMKCIHHFVDHVSPIDPAFLSRLLPEVILSVKNVKEKTRLLAVAILKDIGHCYNKENIEEYFQLVVAGLAGSAHMISATVMSLARLVYEFHDLLSETMMTGLIKSVTMLLSSKCKQVVKACLDFVKVVIGVLEPRELVVYMDSIMEAIFSWDDQLQQHFLFKTKVILERLIKKLGYDVVEGHVPNQHKKLIAHVRKMVAKQQKKKENKGDNKVSKKTHRPSYEQLLGDSEDDEDITPPKSRSSWILEEDDPTDLMSATALQHILASKPTRTPSSVKSEFATSEDGKLVIDQDDEETAAEHSKETSRKRKRDEDHMTTGGVIIDDDKTNKKLRTSSAASGPPGAQYRSQKALGDMKKHGKPDPYAYIPLQRQSLNKRKQRKMAGQYNHILKGARAGSSRARRQIASRKRTLKRTKH